MNDEIVLSVGDIAPEFCLSDQDDNYVCLEHYRNKWKILYFYDSDKTEDSILEAMDFTAMSEGFKKLNAIIIGISTDSTKNHRLFQRNNSLDITLLSDMEHEVIEKYGVWKIISRENMEYHGTENTTFIINLQGKITDIWRKPIVQGHVTEVLNKLIELQKEIYNADRE
jgi:peroxiredoxin Q/BCP